MSFAIENSTNFRLQKIKNKSCWAHTAIKCASHAYNPIPDVNMEDTFLRNVGNTVHLHTVGTSKNRVHRPQNVSITESF